MSVAEVISVILLSGFLLPPGQPGLRRDLLPEEALKQTDSPLLLSDDEPLRAERITADPDAQCPEGTA